MKNTIKEIVALGTSQNTMLVANACILLLNAIADEVVESDEDIEACKAGMQEIAESLADNMGHGYLSQDASACCRKN